MKKIVLLLVACFMLSETELYAQKHTFDSNPPTTVIKQIKRSTGELYDLTITLPADYQPEKAYKILYYLDAWWLDDLVPGCYRVKSLSNKTIENNLEEVILVGISSVGNEEDWNRQRNMDFTPSPFNLTNVTFNYGKVQLNEKSTGGAAQFLRFLKDEIITSIEGQYKVESSSRGILGHSFGGLFGFYVSVNDPELFTNYILISPAIWWNQSELLANKESFASGSRSNMFIAVGTSEARMLRNPITNLVQEVNQEKNTKVNLQYKQYEGADHHSLLPQSIFDALGFIYTISAKDEEVAEE